jgi:hypothetical protein
MVIQNDSSFCSVASLASGDRESIFCEEGGAEE